MNKNIIIGIVIVAALGVIGYFFYPKLSAQDIQQDTNQNTNTENPATSGDQAKINIDEVCNSALAYMSFPNAAAAEVFIADCKEGKHPEVIEQWKVQMGISNDAVL